MRYKIEALTEYGQVIATCYTDSSLDAGIIESALSHTLTVVCTDTQPLHAELLTADDVLRAITPSSKISNVIAFPIKPRL